MKGDTAMNNRIKRAPRFSAFLPAVIAALLCVAAPAFAAGPLFVCNPGQPFLWPAGGTNIPFNPDQGGLGPLTNAQAITLVATSFQQWGNIPSASTTYLQGAALPVDVDETNFGPYFSPAAPDGLSAIVFDEDGAIFDLLFGPGSGVLGFASPEWANFVTCEITGRRLVHQRRRLRGARRRGPGARRPGPRVRPLPEPGPHRGQRPGRARRHHRSEPQQHLPTHAAEQQDRDDVSVLLRHRGGHLHAGQGRRRQPLDPLPGAHLRRHHGHGLGPHPRAQRHHAADRRQRHRQKRHRSVRRRRLGHLQRLSRSITARDSLSSGAYTLRGLTPGAQYAIFVDEILAGGFSTPPLFPLPGPEEFYNGAGESNNAATDNPTVFTPVAVAAGATQNGVNVIFNAPAPDTPLPVGDDGSVELFLPFDFRICGQRFDSVFVNANGNLTFGAGSGDFSESIAEFLAGPPRIAGVWDDLNPGAGGTVFFQQTSNTFTVTYQNVPEFVATGANTFSIVLQRSSNHVDITYGGLTATDGLAGVSCGVAVTSQFEQPTSLSSGNDRRDLKKQPAIFELFGPGNLLDLAGRTVKFNAKATFDDELRAQRLAGPGEGHPPAIRFGGPRRLHRDRAAG